MNRYPYIGLLLTIERWDRRYNRPLIFKCEYYLTCRKVWVKYIFSMFELIMDE